MSKHGARVFIGAVALLTMNALAWAGPKEDVQAAITKFEATVNSGDPDAIAASFTPDGAFWGIPATQWALTPATIKAAFTAALKASPNPKPHVHDATIVALSDNVVRVVGLLTLTQMRAGQPVPTENAYSAVWVKQGDRWLIAQLHGSPLPPR
jgi:uncharacterized protein (TIGR02246 family)